MDTDVYFAVENPSFTIKFNINIYLNYNYDFSNRLYANSLSKPQKRNENPTLNSYQLSATN